MADRSTPRLQDADLPRCAFCRLPYRPVRAGQRFCSPPHRNAAFRLRHPRVTVRIDATVADLAQILLRKDG